MNQIEPEGKEKQLLDEDEVEDEAEKDETVRPVQYEITSFGADYDAEGLVKRLQRGDIYIPPFQRSFVWTQKEASRFIESLLLGLPVPGIFLARDIDSKKLLVIDGQQRLRSIQFFMEGYFNPDPKASSKDVFMLQNVQKQFEGITYDTLEPPTRVVLNDAIIHATIVKQDSPENDQSSIYHIFERLNTTGRKLSPQQIRVAIYHGKFLEMLHNLNENEVWRNIFGKESKTLKDQELILRFLVLYHNGDNYGKSENIRTIKDFLNDFNASYRNCDDEFCKRCISLFENTINVARQILGERVFRLERTINAAVFDSVMVGIARRLEKGEIKDPDRMSRQYQKLFKDKDYFEAVSYATSNERSVKRRIEKAVAIFSHV